MRLCQGAGLFGTNRLVVGDSWFSSVRTAQALRNKGLHFRGVVKTARAMFPLDILSETLKDASRGQSVVFQADIPFDGRTEKYFAVGWKRNEYLTQHFISTCGITLEDGGNFEDEVSLEWV